MGNSAARPSSRAVFAAGPTAGDPSSRAHGINRDIQDERPRRPPSTNTQCQYTADPARVILQIRSRRGRRRSREDQCRINFADHNSRPRRADSNLQGATDRPRILNERPCALCKHQYGPDIQSSHRDEIPYNICSYHTILALPSSPSYH